jgi:exosortase A
MERLMKIKIRNQHFLYITVLVGLFVLVYYRTFLWMYGRFVSTDSYYSHGFIIPFASAFLIWQKRGTLAKMEMGYSKYGLVLIITSLLIHLLSTIFYIFSSSGFSILLLIFGISLFLFGKEVTKAVFFPLLFLIFMFPLPEAFVSLLANPLKMNAARMATFFVDQAGISVYREGFYIKTINGELLVGNPCSGLRSLISFLGLGAFFAYILDMSMARRIILFLLSVPIALASNVIRVIALVLVTHYYGYEKASPDSFFHDFSGVMVFVIGFAILFLAGRGLHGENKE